MGSAMYAELEYFSHTKKPAVATVIYDLPNLKDNTSFGDKDVSMMQHNAAYGVL